MSQEECEFIRLLSFVLLNIPSVQEQELCLKVYSGLQGPKHGSSKYVF